MQHAHTKYSDVDVSQSKFLGEYDGHLLDFYGHKERHVTRATFTAELFGGCDAADRLILLMQTLHEVRHGPTSKTKARAMREEGGFSIKGCLCIDALSVYAAVTASTIKVPTEQSRLCHIQWLRELLDLGVLTAIVWLDTRDMTADGLTEGAVDRVALQQAMRGTVWFTHGARVWTSPLAAIKRTPA